MLECELTYYKLDGLDKDLVLEFFGTFSYLECCLKKCGYAKNSKHGIVICWDRFCKEHKMILSGLDSKMITYFEEKPPKNQIISDCGRLAWEEDAHKGKCSFPRLLVLVRRVRNNLFHGGKYNVEELDRNDVLLRYSLSVLTNCIESLQQTHPACRYD